MSEDRVEVTLEQQQGYRFEARFSNGTPPLITDHTCTRLSGQMATACSLSTARAITNTRPACTGALPV